MNFAMICDVVGGDMKSYYIKDNKGYDFNDNPFEKDERTAHEALKVLKGEKYILQTWFYMYDYASNIDNNCCG